MFLSEKWQRQGKLDSWQRIFPAGPLRVAPMMRFLFAGAWKRTVNESARGESGQKSAVYEAFAAHDFIRKPLDFCHL